MYSLHTQNTPDSQFPGLPGIAVHLPAGENPGLEGEGELRQVDEALLPGVGRVVRERLTHEVRRPAQQVGDLEILLHEFQSLQRDEGIEVAVDTN